MGLSPAETIPPEMKPRGHITVIRRNWHLLSYDHLESRIGPLPGRIDETVVRVGHQRRVAARRAARPGARRSGFSRVWRGTPTPAGQSAGVGPTREAIRHRHLSLHERAEGHAIGILRQARPRRDGRRSRRRLPGDVHLESESAPLADRRLGARVPKRARSGRRFHHHGLGKPHQLRDALALDPVSAMQKPQRRGDHRRSERLNRRGRPSRQSQGQRDRMGLGLEQAWRDAGADRHAAEIGAIDVGQRMEPAVGSRRGQVESGRVLSLGGRPRAQGAESVEVGLARSREKGRV